MTSHHRLLLETTAARDKAEAMLRGLLDAKAVSERHLVEIRQADSLKRVTGRSSMDNAIASTQRMIETLNRTLHELRSELSQDDLDLLGA